MRAALACLVLVSLIGAACHGSGSGTPTPSPVAPSATASPPRTETPPQPTPAATPGPAIEPVGYPLDVAMPTDLVVGTAGSRVIESGRGPSVRDVSMQVQTSDDAALANSSGWNCRVHMEYEGAPAVDWYVPPGTPVLATMDGTATVHVNTFANAFDLYGVAREPYIGDPDRARAPVYVFPGPSGGMRVFVTIVNDEFRAAYGHLDIDATIAAVPPDVFFFADYSRTYDYAAAFARPLPAGVDQPIATWHVRRGDVIGFTGDAGYSEAPHLHYHLSRVSGGRLLCPTTETGFEDGGWLER